MSDIGFEAFVAARSRALMRTAFGLTGDHQKAEDLLQTALLKVYGRWSRIEDPEAYVRQVLVRTYCSWWQRRWRDEISTAVLPERPDPGSAAEPDVNGVLREALSQLPPRQHAVVILRYLDDCTDLQIAQLLDISTGTVKSQASRALATMRGTSLLATYVTEDNS